LRSRSAIGFDVDSKPRQFEPLGKTPRHGGIVFNNQNSH
jgi:hypothetical protein